mmetsp:Transcript_16881/g.31565  ORF Transcript_16881/g.31565 Transcript_16881/m.31565 type:complete len:168 (-) Transcript_16881:191-694(-)|eukprot:CAMPEP_0197459872 /NCGR_PEP_ID=MMETSP1175-20131217/52637_1 /TAXON_ID=1003142 /ORGANISM="Triceratium dubium, Strain CCMP147" /LENGTH=167 /DNA_ID=CAMNT_0042994855 /DNA_START=81 /DNA_END=584 /DNA_ORIENTATION=-
MPSEQEVERERAKEAMSEEQTKQMMFLAAYGVGFAVAMKILAMIALPLFIVALPLVYLYAIQNCPSNDSFDAKKELKRVMRGQNLPQSEPARPKGLLANMIEKTTAAVQTEMATSMGYEVTLASYGGAFTVATVRVPMLEQDCIWIGAFQEWRYLGCREIPEGRKFD